MKYFKKLYKYFIPKDSKIVKKEDKTICELLNDKMLKIGNHTTPMVPITKELLEEILKHSYHFQ